jgi:hypothetical protein
MGFAHKGERTKAGGKGLDAGRLAFVSPLDQLDMEDQRR